MGCTVLDIFCQHRNELTVALADDEQDWMVRGSVQRPDIHLFRLDGHSKARGSDLVPVIVTERTYVTSPTGADPGVVRVNREDGGMVEPGLPE